MYKGIEMGEVFGKHLLVFKHPVYRCFRGVGGVGEEFPSLSIEISCKRFAIINSRLWKHLLVSLNSPPPDVIGTGE
jgi:hypothetical protein